MRQQRYVTKLERYSHIRMAAKREAVAGITLRQKGENSEIVPVKVPVLAVAGFVQWPLSAREVW